MIENSKGMNEMKRAEEQREINILTGREPSKKMVMRITKQK